MLKTYLIKKNIMKTKLLILLFFPLVSFTQSYEALFLGNSYTFYNDLPQMVKEIATSMGDTLLVDSNTPGGATLSVHAQANSQSLQKIAEKNWDFVVIQAQSQEPSFHPAQVESQTYPYAEQLVNAIESNYSCTEPLFFMTWGRKNGDQMNAQNYPPIATYSGMQQRLRESYLEMGYTHNASVAPVGMAWKKSINDNTDFELYTPDESHPNLAGSYLSACVIYTSMFQESCVNSDYVPNGLDEDDAAVLQGIASSVVLDSTQVWNLFDVQNIDVQNVSGNDYSFSLQASNYSSILWEFNGSTSTNATVNFNFSETDTVFLTAYSNGEDCFKIEEYHIVNIDNTTSYNCVNEACIDPLNGAGSFSTLEDCQQQCGATSVIENELISSVFPNPAIDYINIKTNNKAKISLHDLMGKLVYQSDIDNFKTIDTKDLSQGTYVLSLTNNKQVFKRKVIINGSK